MKNSQIKQTPTLIDRGIIYIIMKVKRVRHIIEMGTSEAYDLGYKMGMVQMAKEVGGKKYQNKIKRILKKRYNQMPEV